MNFKQFCMTTLAVVAGIFITGVLSMFGMIYMMLQMILLNLGKEHPSTERQSILHIELSSEIVEREQGTTIMQQLQGIENNSISLNRLLDALKIASTDPKIEGVYLDCGGVSAGVATLMSVNEAINTFRKSGKWVAAYADSYAQGDYILASAADSLWLNPVGEVDIHGVGAGLFYFKGLLDKLGVDVQVFKVGTYKSAVEPFLLTQPSEANIRQTREYLDPIWADVRTVIAAGRKCKPRDNQHMGRQHNSDRRPGKLSRHECSVVATLPSRRRATAEINVGYRFRRRTAPRDSCRIPQPVICA